MDSAVTKNLHASEISGSVDMSVAHVVSVSSKLSQVLNTSVINNTDLS